MSFTWLQGSLTVSSMPRHLQCRKPQEFFQFWLRICIARKILVVRTKICIVRTLMLRFWELGILKCRALILRFWELGILKCLYSFILITFLILNKSFDKRITSLEINEYNILLIKKNLNPDKARGWNNLSIIMIKICSKKSLTLSLKLIFNSMFHEGVFSEDWKKSNVVSVHKIKKDSKNLIKNYRPISLLPIPSKAFLKTSFQFSV